MFTYIQIHRYATQQKCSHYIVIICYVYVSFCFYFLPFSYIVYFLLLLLVIVKLNRPAVTQISLFARHVSFLHYLIILQGCIPIIHTIILNSIFSILMMK